MATTLFAAASAIVYVSEPSVNLSFHPRRPFPAGVIQGFYPSEVTPEGTAFAWTNGHAVITLRELDRRTDWHLRLRLAKGTWPPEVSRPTVRVSFGGPSVQTLSPTSDFVEYEVTIPRRSNRRGVSLGLDSPVFTPGGSDPRQLGVVVAELSLRPRGLVRPSPGWCVAAVVAGTSIATACAVAGLGVLPLAVLLTLLGFTYGWLVRPGSGESLAGTFVAWQAALWVAGLSALVATAVRVANCRVSHHAKETLTKTAVLCTEPLVLLAAVHLSMLALGLPFPLLTTMTRWRVAPAGPWYLLAALAVVPFAGWLITRRLRDRPALAVCSLVCLGFLFQQGFAWSEGHGFDGMRARMRNSGHWEFALVAEQQPSMWEVLVHYDAKLQHDELGTYAHSKPPGQLLFYMATERLASRWSQGSGETQDRLAATQTLAAITWPLLSYLVLVPLYFTLRQLVESQTALLACVLYIVVPAVALITMHTDQVLFPFLFVTTVWMGVTAQAKHSWPWACATGVVLYICSFFTYALVLAGVVGVGCAAAVERKTAAGPSPLPALGPLINTTLGIVAGFCLMFLACAVGLHYDFLVGLRDATAFHEAWRNWRGGIYETVHYAWRDLLEFAVWLGVPLSVLTLGSFRRALRSVAAGCEREDALVWPAISLLVLLVYLGFFSHTKGETARLWLFLSPVCCALAAGELRRRYSESVGTMTAVVLLLQWLTLWLLKTGRVLA